MTKILILSRSMLGTGIRIVLEQHLSQRNGHNYWCDTNQEQDPVNLSMLARSLRPEVTIFDATSVDALALFSRLDLEQIRCFGMMVVVTVRQPQEEALFLLQKYGVAAYCSASISPQDFASIVERVSHGEWLLNSEILSRDDVPQDPPAQGGGAISDHEGSPLSPRETDVLGCIALGKSNKEIAAMLRMSDQTVKNHITSIFKKMGINSRTGCVIYAINRKWLPLPPSSALFPQPATAVA